MVFKFTNELEKWLEYNVPNDKFTEVPLNYRRIPLMLYSSNPDNKARNSDVTTLFLAK